MSTAPRTLHPALAFGLDLLMVLAFCAVGRASHQEDASLAGYLTTAWPFVVGLVVGTAVLRALRLLPEGLPAGAVIWVATLALGMILRAVSGQGTALAFVIVATLVLALVLFAWRLVARVVRRARTAAR